MKFAIITHVPHIIEKEAYFAYAPYVKEMNIWLQYVDVVLIIAPNANMQKSAIDVSYKHSNIQFIEVKSFCLINFISILKTIIHLPKIIWNIFKAMQQADHIHLRCPGNMGLLGAMVQLFFPNKPKTAKYAGNWDPESKQPLSYKLQRWILSNTFLTKNMQVLVYGEWENQTQNIKPFFTASYFDQEKLQPSLRNLNREIKCLFVGTITQGKNPVYAIELIKKIREKGIPIRLDLYGNGVDKNRIEAEIAKNKWDSFICFKGNQAAEMLKMAYQESHFMVLPSQSEGWPKAVAEAMFWGCVPITTPVSCVPTMLGNGTRGKLLTMDIESDATEIIKLLQNEKKYQKMSHEALLWSQKYTFDCFEKEIKKLLN